MVRLCLLLVFAFLAAGFDVGFEDGMMKKYGKMKILSSCFGEETVMQWKQKMMEACQLCRQQAMTTNVEPNMGDFASILQNYPGLKEVLQNPTMGSNPYNQIYSNQRPPQPVFLYIPPRSAQIPTGPHQIPPTTQLYPGSGYYPSMNPQNIQRFWKRSAEPFPEPSPAVLEPKKEQQQQSRGSRQGNNYMMKMKTRIMDKIGNMSCVLQKMGLIDDQMMPNYSYMTQMIQDLPVTDMLKGDLLEGQDYCREYSMCLPVHKLKNPIAKELGYATSFIKCFNKKKLLACMKQDYRKYHQEGGLPDAAQRDLDGMGLSRSFLQGDDQEGSESMMDELADVFESGF